MKAQGGGGEGAGGTLIFSGHMGSAPASALYPKNIWSEGVPQKISDILCIPKTIFEILV